ncbi:MAG: hypothetical protein Q4F63_00990 [Clostridia bacterium]|nr:hypothetical protein [Clostridia bacterium]
MKKLRLLYGMIIILVYIVINGAVVFGNRGNGYLTTDGNNIYKIVEDNPRSGNMIYRYDMRGLNGRRLYSSQGYIEIKGVFGKYLYFNEYSSNNGDTGLKAMNLKDNSVKRVYDLTDNVEYFGGSEIYLRKQKLYFEELLCVNVSGNNVKYICDNLKEYTVKNDELYYIQHIDNQTNCFGIYKADADGSNPQLLYDNFIGNGVYFSNEGLIWELLEQGKYDRNMSLESKSTYYLRDIDTGKDEIINIKEYKNIDLSRRVCSTRKEKEYYYKNNEIYRINAQNDIVKVGKIRFDNAYILGVEDQYLYYANDKNKIKKIKLKTDKNIFSKIFEALTEES